jgi:deazaflavin-dependent oxidoreductase (nitroreductase family)
MTAAQSEQIGQVRPVPRLFLQTFWRLHRAMYRVTAGRFGLQRPERGTRFGMLRIRTVGRRSGKQRITMLGYYEDGANFVTLAMNGWGKADPAWWLNLQANSAATVELPDGPRQVRARAATGEERERLWARFRDYPGWGADVDALAAHRPGGTAIVVLEPVQELRPIPAPMEVAVRPSVHTPEGQGRQGRRLRWRHLWIVPGLGIAILANQLGNEHGVGILALVAFGIAPDVPRLLGLGRRPVTSLPVRVFNLMHHPAAPAAAVTVGVTGVVPPVWLVASLVWLGHVVIGWGVGDVPRKRGNGSDAWEPRSGQP